MSREEQIVEAGKTAAEGKEFSVLVNKQRRTMSAYEIGFIEGAEWADSHPALVSVEDELPKEKGAYLFHFDDGQTRVEVTFQIFIYQSVSPTGCRSRHRQPRKEARNEMDEKLIEKGDKK